MDYITSRRFRLPETAQEMTTGFWFNMWQTRQWPYQELMPGDGLYWYESPDQRLVWYTVVTQVDRFAYTSKAEAGQRMRSRFGGFDDRQPYFVDAPAQGYCLAWKVTPIERLDRPKPEGVRFPMLGWLRVNAQIAEQWSLQPGTEEITLDTLVPQGDLHEQLRQINAAMMDVAPQRVQTLVTQTIRHDTRIIRALKELCGYRCQFPDCGVQIPKRGGGFYIEVAHIQAVAGGGRSVLGNLLVLCPNHHKAFDYGELQITEQRIDYLQGRLNGRLFEIHMPAPK